MSVAHATSIKIALVIHALRGGGAERLMSQLASRWAEAGHDVHLITLAATVTDDYPLDPRVVRHGLDLMKVSRSRLRGIVANWQRVGRLRVELRRLQPQFILSFCDRMNIVTATARARAEVPLWLAEHSDPRRQNLGWLWERWRDYAYPRSSGCVVLTDPIASWMQVRFPNLPLKTIPPAIRFQAQSSSTESSGLSATLDRSVGTRRLLALGRHSPEKNMRGLLRAWKELASEHPDWTLIMAGDGPEHGALLQECAQLGLSDRIEFTGWVNHPNALMRDCDALVLPSHYEGFPVTLLEAMSAGLACASTPCSDSVQAMAAEGAVEVARSAEPADIAAAVHSLLSSSERRGQLAAAGRQLVAQYDWSEIGPRWDRLLEQAVATQQRR